MPDKELTPLENEAVRAWIKANRTEDDTRMWLSFNDGFIGSGVYQVNNEPLVMEGRKKDQGVGGVEFIVHCSDKHAQALEAAGVLSFQEAPEKV